MGDQIYECRKDAARERLPEGYRRHEPEKTVLYGLISDELATFRARILELGDTGLPSFVWRELERYLECGILAHGFARVRCVNCHDEMLVGFSCKGRGLCPSCGARRTHDTAAHLVDQVLPPLPFRQWVLSYPKWLRPYLARDPSLAAAARDTFLASVFAWQRRQARKLGLRTVAVGAVTFSQRAGDSLNLNPHLHSITPDGAFTETESEVEFHRLPKPKDEDVRWVAERIVRRTLRMLERRGLRQSEEPPDTLDMLTTATLSRGRAAPWDETRSRSPLSVWIDGFSLQAGTHVHENDRAGLEHLCAYAARPPLALGRLSRREDGRYAYALKYPLPDGSYELVLTGQQLMGRIALLVPRPRVHLVLYHGVFAPRSRWRPWVVPEPVSDEQTGPVAQAQPTSQPEPAAQPQQEAEASGELRARRLDWASLLKRVYGHDVLTCDRCGGSRRIIAFIEDPKVARKILDHLGLDSTGPPRAAARPPPQTEMFGAAAWGLEALA
jgi:hypothetical protein